MRRSAPAPSASAPEPRRVRAGRCRTTSSPERTAASWADQAPASCSHRLLPGLPGLQARQQPVTAAPLPRTHKLVGWAVSPRGAPAPRGRCGLLAWRSASTSLRSRGQVQTHTNLRACTWPRALPSRSPPRSSVCRAADHWWRSVIGDWPARTRAPLRAPRRRSGHGATDVAAGACVGVAIRQREV